MVFRNDDRRRAPRIPFVLRVGYRNKSQWIDATENLSAGGLFIQTDLSFRIGEEVRVELSFPGLLDPIEINGEVAWVRGPADERGAGVGLQVKDPDERKRLEQLVDQSSTQTHGAKRELE